VATRAGAEGAVPETGLRESLRSKGYLRPVWMPGSYRLKVSGGPQNDAFHVTIGALGPPGSGLHMARTARPESQGRRDALRDATVQSAIQPRKDLQVPMVTA
jgi:hypothetical protein